MVCHSDSIIALSSNAGLAHEPRDALAVHLDAQAQRQLGRDPRRSVAPARPGVDALDQLQQLPVPDLPR